MKWLSIKKFVPPTGQELLIRIQKNKEAQFMYEKYLIGTLESYGKSVNINNIQFWHLSNNSINSDYDDFHVTHFASLDAVEIE